MSPAVLRLDSARKSCAMHPEHFLNGLLSVARFQAWVNPDTSHGR